MTDFDKETGEMTFSEFSTPDGTFLSEIEINKFNELWSELTKGGPNQVTYEKYLQLCIGILRHIRNMGNDITNFPTENIIEELFNKIKDAGGFENNFADIIKNIVRHILNPKTNIEEIDLERMLRELNKIVVSAILGVKPKSGGNKNSRKHRPRRRKTRRKKKRRKAKSIKRRRRRGRKTRKIK